MLGAGQAEDAAEEKRILLHFKTRYLTKWGQNLVVSGAGVLFGNYDPKRCASAGSTR